MRIDGAALCSMPYSVFLMSSLLLLLDGLDGEPQLLADLTVRRTVEVRHPRVHLEHRVHGRQHVLTRLFFVADEGFRQTPFVPVGAFDGDSGWVQDAITAVDARFDRYPLKKMDEPPRGDTRHLRNGLGRVRQCPRSDVAECMVYYWVSHCPIVPLFLLRCAFCSH
jgi:hypothetical protein